MRKLYHSIVVVFGVLSLITIIALLGGTVVYLIWPVAVQAFPALVNHDILAENLSWGQAVCLVWLFAILIKSPSSTSNK
jgi:hypothetical protein